MPDPIFNVDITIPLRAVLDGRGVVMAHTKDGDGPVIDRAIHPVRTTGVIGGQLMAIGFALLSEDGTYLGLSTDPAHDVGGPIVPASCDLEKGKYRWDQEKGRFEPIMARFKTDQKQTGKEPDALIAIALGLRAYRDKRPLPPYTVAWIETFDRYTDDVGT